MGDSRPIITVDDDYLDLRNLVPNTSSTPSVSKSSFKKTIGSSKKADTRNVTDSYTLNSRFHKLLQNINKGSTNDTIKHHANRKIREEEIKDEICEKDVSGDLMLKENLEKVEKENLEKVEDLKELDRTTVDSSIMLTSGNECGPLVSNQLQINRSSTHNKSKKENFGKDTYVDRGIMTEYTVSNDLKTVIQEYASYYKTGFNWDISKYLMQANLITVPAFRKTLTLPPIPIEMHTKKSRSYEEQVKRKTYAYDSESEGSSVEDFDSLTRRKPLLASFVFACGLAVLLVSCLITAMDSYEKIFSPVVELTEPLGVFQITAREIEFCAKLLFRGIYDVITLPSSDVFRTYNG